MSVLERFWSKVDKAEDDGCWLWTAACRGRYGTFRVTTGQMVSAHRFSWSLVNGDIPDGMYVCHKCDVPLCVRPDHLFLGTASDNHIDMHRKGRGNPPRGDRHHSSRVTEAQRTEIVRLYMSGKWTQKDLAQRYGMTQSGMSRLLSSRGASRVV